LQGFQYLLSTFSFSDFKKLRSEKHIRAKPFPGTGFAVGKKSNHRYTADLLVDFFCNFFFTNL